MSSAAEIIAALNLQPHPEGGWYRETWRAAAPNGARAGGTAIHFLLEAGQTSHWHRVDASELWLFQAGAPLILRTAKGETGEGDKAEVLLGGDVLAGQVTQHVVAPQEWQAAEAGDGWTLVSCVVVPGFEFSGFELAPAGWSPKA